MANRDGGKKKRKENAKQEKKKVGSLEKLAIAQDKNVGDLYTSMKELQ